MGLSRVGALSSADERLLGPLLTSTRRVAFTPRNGLPTSASAVSSSSWCRARRPARDAAPAPDAEHRQRRSGEGPWPSASGLGRPRAHTHPSSTGEVFRAWRSGWPKVAGADPTAILAPDVQRGQPDAGTSERSRGRSVIIEQEATEAAAGLGEEPRGVA